MSLQIIVESGKALPNLEWIGKIDPFVELNFAGTKKRTKYISNETEPKWNETLEFNLDSKPLKATEFVELKAYDHEHVMPNRLLGSYTIALRDVVLGKRRAKRHECKLRDPQGRQSEGVVVCRVTYTPPSGSETSSYSLGQRRRGGSYVSNTRDECGDIDFDEDGTVEAHLFGGIGGLRKKTTKKHSNLSKKPRDFQVRVKVWEARQLAGEKINPVCKVTVSNKTKVTRIKKSTNRPNWDEIFFFDFHTSPADLFDDAVKFQVFNSGKLRNDFIGEFKLDVGTIYEQDDHCINNKWLLLSSTDHAHAGVKGYLLVSLCVLGSGDKAPIFKKLDEINDEETNLLRPATISLQEGMFIVKVYRAEDVPQMDTAFFERFKMVFKRKDEKKELVDPYLTVNFAGQNFQTSVKYDDRNPQWNEEIRVPVKFPSMCEKLQLQLKDWDRVTKDDVIGTAFLDLPTISSPGDKGYLPTFGPTFVNFYGSTREFSEFPDQFEDLNMGKGEGVAYRGRVFVKVETKIGQPPDKILADIPNADIQSVRKYLNRCKYRLFCALLDATLISESDASVQFEISIGNYGNAIDDGVAPQPSTTQPTNAVYDGCKHYFLPWSESKPLLIVDSEWEDISYRLESLNILLRKVERLEANMERVRLAVKRGDSPSEIRSGFISTIDVLIDDCEMSLPGIENTAGRLNELDLRRKPSRDNALMEIRQDAAELKSEIHDKTSDEVMEAMHGFLQLLQDLAVEPQNSMPDVILWMLQGNKRIAYQRIPAYHVLHSSVSQDACGKLCGKVSSFFLKYPGQQHASVGVQEVPGMIRARIWLGQEKDRSSFQEGLTDSDIAVSAETYENEMKVAGKWKNTPIGRSNWSDSSGKIKFKQPNDGDRPPASWNWDGGLIPSPDLSLVYDADAGQTNFLEDIYEMESRSIPGDSWEPHTPHYTTVKGDPAPSRQELEPPEGWEWDDAWSLDKKAACDMNGFEYCIEPSTSSWGPVEKLYHLYRRRRWIRPRSLKGNAKDLMKKKRDVAKQREWEYAPLFNMKFHSSERKMDMVRRRRWHRKMAPSDTEMVFCFTGTGDKKTVPEFVPRIFLLYTEVHHYQLRTYVFRARDLIAADYDGSSDPYAYVSFLSRSQKTKTVKNNRSPMWDQTLVFDEIEIYGDPKHLADSPPEVVVDLFDEDRVSSHDFMGRVTVCPMVRLQESGNDGACLTWHQIYMGEGTAGELLASAELFLEGLTPPSPTQKEDGLYKIPKEIRPEIQLTRVEILCLGVRNMKTYQLSAVTSPSLEFEIGGEIIKSPVIRSTKKSSGTLHFIGYIDVELPTKQLYCPPINIRVHDHRAFGRTPIVGTCAINKIEPYRCQGVPSSNAPQTVPWHRPGGGPSVPNTENRPECVIDVEFEEDQEEEEIDWWSKYYASTGEEEDELKCSGFIDKGYDKLKIYPTPLESVEKYDSFQDVCKTYKLHRGKALDNCAGERQGFGHADVGEFKGMFKIYSLPEKTTDAAVPRKQFSKNIVPSYPIECVVRIYVIKGINLHPQDLLGLADPYLKIKLGKTKIDDVDNFIPNTLDPVFGRMFEMKTTLPFHKDLKIAVMDKDLVIKKDDLIGETVIDLENRYLSKYRATVGLPKTYTRSGSNRWRDQRTPRELLATYCRNNGIPQPEYLSGKKLSVGGETHELDESSGGCKKEQKDSEDLTKQQLSLQVLRDFGLVPEHVETRPIFSPLMPGIEQGKLQMWVDIFPVKLGPLRPPVDITPRQPKGYVLRCIVWNCEDVDLKDTTAFGEKMSDIYVKGWIQGMNEKLKTDVHYRSLNGEGNFNWRMCFPFDYVPAEQKLTIKKKEHLWSIDKTERRVDPVLVIQVWDNDKFTCDDIIGEMKLDLNHTIKPKKKARDVPRAGGNEEAGEPTVSLFRTKRLRGWWPVRKNTISDTTGKVELELEILTAEEAEARPAGNGRDEPNAHPKLDPPRRPVTSFLWFTSPWKSYKHILWHNNRRRVICFLLVIIFIILVIVLIDPVASAAMQKLMGII